MLTALFRKILSGAVRHRQLLKAFKEPIKRGQSNLHWSPDGGVTAYTCGVFAVLAPRRATNLDYSSLPKFLPSLKTRVFWDSSL